MDIWYYLMMPFTWLLKVFYQFFGSSYGLAIGAAMGLYFLGIFINMDTSLEPLRFVTPYYYAEAARVFAGEPLADAVAAGCGLGALGAAFGLWRYGRKDIAA